MNDELKHALAVLCRYRPCPHEHNEKLGTRTAWARCEDCGITFSLDRLPIYQRAAEQFDESVQMIAKAIGEADTDFRDFIRRWVDEWEATWVDPDEINHAWAELYAEAKHLLRDSSEQVRHP